MRSSYLVKRESCKLVQVNIFRSLHASAKKGCKCSKNLNSQVFERRTWTMRTLANLRGNQLITIGAEIPEIHRPRRSSDKTQIRLHLRWFKVDEELLQKLKESSCPRPSTLNQSEKKIKRKLPKSFLSVECYLYYCCKSWPILEWALNQCFQASFNLFCTWLFVELFVITQRIYALTHNSFFPVTQRINGFMDLGTSVGHISGPFGAKHGFTEMNRSKSSACVT